MMAKLSDESVPPPGPMPLLLELLVEDEAVVELDEVVEVVELDEVVEVVELVELEELVVPEQAQGPWASPRQIESHMVLQQKLSIWHTAVTQEVQPDWSAAPVVQGEWAQALPEELVVVVEELLDVVVVEELLDVAVVEELVDVVVVVLELEELDEVPQVLGLGGAWQ
jgi:hypothetical protein